MVRFVGGETSLPITSSEMKLQSKFSQFMEWTELEYKSEPVKTDLARDVQLAQHLCKQIVKGSLVLVFISIQVRGQHQHHLVTKGGDN